MNELLGMPLKEIITSETIDDLFKAKFTSETGKVEEFNQLKDSPYFDMLKYLVWQGFIDETYSDYLTYFYDHSIKRADKIFLRSVTDKKAKVAAYVLENPEMVTSRLPLQYFGQKETLNYALFDYLLSDFSSERSFQDKARWYIQQLIKNKCFSFIVSYSEQTDQIDNMVKAFGAEWPSFVSDFFDAMSIGEEPAKPKTKSDIFIQKHAYVILALLGVDAQKISYLDEGSIELLREYLSHDEEFLSVNDCDVEKVVLGMQRLGIILESINAVSAYQLLLEQVYQKGLYVINFGNIATMLETFYPRSDFKNLHTANYTALMTKAESPLAQYVNAHIDNYMSVYLDECGAIITDTAENVLLLLNNDCVERDKKLQYITYLQTSISKITDVDETELWEALLENIPAVEYTAANVFCLHK